MSFTLKQPTRNRELWLASAMLAVTFPIMVAYSNFFQYWLFRTVADKERGWTFAVAVLRTRFFTHLHT